MSQSESLKVVQEAYANFKRGDIPALLNMMTTDVEWYLPGSPEVVPFAGRRSGREQVGQFFSKLTELQETEQFEPREFIAQDDKVVALGNYRWRLRSNGRIYESEFAHVFTVRDGKVSKFHEYYDTGVVNEAYRPV